MQAPPNSNESLLVTSLQLQYQNNKPCIQSIPKDNVSDIKSLDFTNSIPTEYRTLDRLAFLLNGAQTCTAVSIQKREIKQGKIEPVLLIGSNEKCDMQLLGVIMTQLKKAAQLPPQHSNEQIMQIVKGITDATSKVDTPQPEARYSNYAMKVVRHISEGKDQFAKDFRAALLNQFCAYQTLHGAYKNPPHAEMQIIDKIVSDKNTVKGGCYIGISKLCCANCMDAIETFNEVNKKNLVGCRGAHLHIYYSSTPNFAINDNKYEALRKRINDRNKLEVDSKKYKQQEQYAQSDDDELNKQGNLRRYGRGQGEGEMMKELVEVNAGKGTVLEEMRRKVSGEVKVEGKQDGAKKSGHVELLREVHDEHGASVGKLVERMEKMSEEEGKRSVVALERKEGGEHLGMRDVRLLAEVLRHNEGKKDAEKIKLPAGIEETALLWDAKLVSEAQKHGVQVVGVEGKSLAHGQQSQEYNADREDYMAQQLAKLKRQGYNVVMPVGEAHVQGLQARLNANAAMETMRGMIQQNNAPLGPDNKGPHIPQHTATTKQVYGKFTAQLAHGNPNNHSVM